jgi:hypothetical protein
VKPVSDAIEVLPVKNALFEDDTPKVGATQDESVSTIWLTEVEYVDPFGPA